MAAHLFNLLPSSVINNAVPFTKLFNKPATYAHLRVFGCLCYPNLLPTALNKLSPRSTRCIFLGYPTNHRGYRCLELSTNRIIISRHVVFEETTFPYTSTTPPPPPPAQVPTPVSYPLPPLVTPMAPPPHSSNSLSPINSVSPQYSSPPSHSSVQVDTPTQQSTADSASSSSGSPPNIPVATTTAPPPPPPPPTRMTTRSQSGIIKTKKIISLHTALVSPLPRSHVQAKQDPNWNPAMTDEYDALQVTKTWDLVPRPPNANILRSMWLFRHKFNADGTLSRYKARLVANGKSQEVGVDCDETLSQRALWQP